MKKFCKTGFQIGIALLLLGVGIKFLMNFLGNMEESEEEEHREPYQAEEE